MNPLLVSYARVSSTDDRQTNENQTRDLEQWIAAHPDVTVVARLTEQESSRKTRPQHERALAMLRSGEANTLLFWALDRWSRTMTELVLEADEGAKKGWRFISLKEDLDLSSAAGQLYLHMMGAFANFERSRISERTKAGLRNAVANGKKLGRPRKWNPAVMEPVPA